MRRSAKSAKAAATGGPGKGDRYHHGDLRTALVDAAIELIGERGVAGFSLAEASRRIGVTVAAPYRHFADREDLLAAVAARAAETLARSVAAESARAGEPADRLVAAATAYIGFASARVPLFQALFAAGFDKARHPELDTAARPILDGFLAPARALVDTGDAAERLAMAVVATAHGHAMLLTDGAFNGAADPVAAAVERATTATRALVAGRSAFAEP
ncbi:MAG TPA: TetR/AcrR family transcriptional regulator [Streptosporangiaceae bacterium]|jgi:AcrR family transcriptional regulator